MDHAKLRLENAIFTTKYVNMERNVFMPTSDNANIITQNVKYSVKMELNAGIINKKCVPIIMQTCVLTYFTILVN